MMREEENVLEEFETHSFGKYDASSLAAGESCPTASQVFKYPVKMVDYVGCHKIFLIFVLVIIISLFYTGTQAVKKAKDAEGGKKDK